MKRCGLILSAVLLLSVVINIYAQKRGDGNASSKEKLVQLYNLLDATYIESLDMEPLVEEAIRTMLGELDPHSSYISTEEMKGVEESFNGEFSGVGIQYSIIRDTLMVVNTIVGAPAESVGVMPNDRIISIDGESAIGITSAQVQSRLKGLRRTKVEIEVLRQGVNEPLRFIIVRDNIPLHTLDAAYPINDTTLYLRVNRFGQTTMREFNEAFNAHKGITSILLDLRSNGGGLLSEAVDMVNFFLPRGSVVVYTQGRQYPLSSIETQHNGTFLDGKVMVIIDENSASASEIVAGAIQDWDRGVIVGQPSFGKGLIQRQFPLVDGSAARITVAEYLTPSHRAIQRPYNRGEGEEYYRKHFQRLITHSDSTTNDENHPIHKTLIKGREVKGGGGITPDIIIEQDTTRKSTLYYSLMRLGLINEFTMEYLDKNRKQLTNRYPSFEEFNQNFHIDNTTLDALYALGQEHSLCENLSEDDAWGEIAAINLKALLAQRLFSTSHLYYVANQSDSTYLKAVEYLLK